MHIQNLRVKQFRNIQSLSLDLNNQINYFYSPNGTGKTNILECLQCLSMGKSLRASREADVAPHIDIEGVDATTNLLNDNQRSKFTTTFLSCDYVQDVIKSNQYSLQIHKYGKKVISKKKQILINKNKVTATNYLGHLPSIWFSPENIRIINSSPASKRKYLDIILVQLSKEYASKLKDFNRILKIKNKILKHDIVDKQNLEIWNTQFVKLCSYITYYRSKFILDLNKIFDKKCFNERYAYTITLEMKHKIDINKSILTTKKDDVLIQLNQFYSDLLSNLNQKEIIFHRTLFGSQNESWQLYLMHKGNVLQPLENKKKEISSKKNITKPVLDGQYHEFINASNFASRGEQRMALLYLQFALIEIFKQEINSIPILLLDDIFSELDRQNIDILLDFINKNNVQTFISGIEKKDFLVNVGYYNVQEILKDNKNEHSGDIQQTRFP